MDNAFRVFYRNFSRLLIILIIPTLAKSQELDRDEKALKIIREFADGFCKEIPLDIKEETYELNGTGKFRVGKVVEQLSDAGINGAIKYKSKSYQGILQTDLAFILKENNNCRILIWNDLKNRMILDVPYSISAPLAVPAPKFHSETETSHGFTPTDLNPMIRLNCNESPPNLPKVTKVSRDPFGERFIEDFFSPWFVSGEFQGTYIRGKFVPCATGTCVEILSDFFIALLNPNQNYALQIDFLDIRGNPIVFYDRRNMRNRKLSYSFPLLVGNQNGSTIRLPLHLPAQDFGMPTSTSRSFSFVMKIYDPIMNKFHFQSNICNFRIN